jgi:anti-sigma B factor antagonist
MSIPGAQEADSAFTISCRQLEDDEKAALAAAGHSGDGVVIGFSGELDLGTAPVAEAELLRAEASQDLIVLDLDELTFIDSTGLRLMIGADRRARERGASFVIVRAGPQARRLLDLSGVAGHLDIVESLAGQTTG